MTTTQHEAPHTPAALQLVPYVFLYGKCEEALEFYATVFAGKYELKRVGESHMRDRVPAELHNLVMHATFNAPGITFMASDGRETKEIDPEAGNMSLALQLPDRATGDEVFTALSAGGKVVMPLGDALWGGCFGMINDRFGNQWMVSTP